MVVRSLSFVIQCLFIALFVSFNSFAANKLTATLDRNPVMERESFVLEITADDSVSANELDLSPLNKSGLVVGRTSTSSQTQIINGSISKTTTWSVVLMAKKAGTYKIPALQVDGAKSQAITVEVIKVDPNQASSQPIFLKNQLEKNQVYLQQTTKMVTRLYISPDVELQSGSLSHPELTGANVEQVGKDQNTSDIVMGKRYQVIERVYAITPQASGEFVITSPTFNGEVLTANRRRSMFNMGQTKPVSAFGQEPSLKVLPIPSDYQGAWLASELVQLHEEFTPQQVEYEVGEAITRTFTLMALNVNEEQLPEVSGTYPAGFKVYPDQTESKSAARKNALVAQRISSEAIVVNQPGTYVLPEVKVPWFNVKTGQQEFAKLPERTIKVLPASGQQQTQVIVAPSGETITPIEQCPVVQPCENANNSATWHWSHYLGWVLWLLTSFTWLLVKLTNKKSNGEGEPVNRVINSEFDIKKLKQACSNNQASSARQELLLWAKATFGQQTDWAQLKTKVSPEFNAQLELLDASQYSTTKQAWLGKGLWLVFQQEYKKPTQSNKNKQQDLPPLN